MDDNKLKSLYFEITKSKSKPLDFWEISALLEIYGIRDIDAQNEYGFKDIFEMAQYLEKYKNEANYKSHPMAVFEKPPKFGIRIFRNYFKGLAFAMPMLVQIFFTLVVGYAIWSGMEMDREKATVIAMGTFLALLVSGGAAQAIGRKGLFYLKQKQYILASMVTKSLIKIALVIMVVVGVVMILFNMFFQILPSYYFYILIMFYFLLTILFLNISVFQMFEEYYTIMWIFIIGIIFVYFFHTLKGIELPEAQFFALVLLNILLTIYTFYRFYKLERISIGEGETVPRWSIMFFTLIPFYLYGFFYFGFLIMDRLIAWSTNIDGKPYFIWFDIPYEIGVDWALIALILLMGMAEVSIYEFIYRINENITKFAYYDYKKFNETLKKGFYYKFNIFYLFFSIFIVLIVYWIMKELYYNYHIEFLKNFFESYTPYIYWYASIGYVFLVHALINILFIFSFSRQVFAVKAITMAVMINLILGIILSRSIDLEYAVIGLLIGSIVFWWFSFKYALRMFNRLEFYYYSAI